MDEQDFFNQFLSNHDFKKDLLDFIQKAEHDLAKECFLQAHPQFEIVENGNIGVIICKN